MTIALGGVATGSMKAQDADIVAGIIIKKGCISILMAEAAKIGIIIVVMAVLDVNSVRKVMIKHIDAIIRSGGT